MKSIIALMLGCTLLAGNQAAAAEKAKTTSKSNAQKTLASGTYTATVKAIVCEGCGAFIEETLNNNPGIESVSVDQAAKTVRFSVKKGAQVKMSELQDALRASADRMGMGADYTLGELKKTRS